MMNDVERVEFFGIRHLSPAGAFEVRKKLDNFKPDIILVEGPSDLNDYMKWICDSRTKFPIAMMAYTKDSPVHSILYPFTIYSPEVQAIKWAFENNVECKFMDLPSDVFLAFEKADEQNFLEKSDNDDIEQCCATESIYKKLEIATGENHDSFWERNFEQLAGSGKYQQACNIFGKELRALSHNSKKDTAENFIRESFMKRQIQNALGSGKNRIFCVCGAFHVAGLESNIAMTDEELKLLPKVNYASSLMPYTYFRLFNKSGYGAGNNAPSYYQMLWDAIKNHRLSEFAENYFVSLAREHRKEGFIVSSADVIEAVRLSKVLANLRGSFYPTLDDLHDAAVTAIGHGNYSELVNSFVKIEIKSEVGKLPDGVSRTCIQDDFYKLLDKFNLNKYRKETFEKIELDLRENVRVKNKEKAFIDLHKSFFFNRLNVLGIAFATELDSNQVFGNWKEIWNVGWTVETEIQIVEASLFGETIASATAYKLRELADKATSIDEAAEIFNKAFLCGLTECCGYVLRILENLSVDDSGILSISKTALYLSNVIRFGDLRLFDSTILIPLLQKLFLRFCLILENACICDGEAVEKVIDAMDIMNKVQLNHDFFKDKKDDLIKLFEKISNRDDLSQKCSGFALSILLERGEADETLVLVELSRRLNPGIPADLGATWFEGLSAKNHYALIARLSLWKHLSEYIKTLDDEEFKRAVVFLRRAFADFSEKEKVEISENLAHIWGYDEDKTSQFLTSQLSDNEKAKVKEIDLASLDDFDFDDI